MLMGQTLNTIFYILFFKFEIQLNYSVIQENVSKNVAYFSTFRCENVAQIKFSLRSRIEISYRENGNYLREIASF